ncbi:MAG: arginine--tRNA ligase [Erysipelotrichaceae bacterium]
MNKIEQSLKEMIINAVKELYGLEFNYDEVVIEIPKEKAFGDYSTNMAMRLTKQLKKNPRIIADELSQAFDKSIADVEKCEIAGAGFINFFLNKASVASVIKVILDKKDAYGSSDFGQGVKYNLEYVSANPTGDLHPGHARGAATGDATSRIMKFAGYDVTREYYINDAGNQINNMALSLQARYFQQFNQDLEMPKDGYYGKDIINIAQDLIAEVDDRYLHMSLEESLPYFRKYGLEKEIDKLRLDLKTFNVEFDIWTSEQSMYDQNKVASGLEVLKSKGYTYELDGALWLKTTDFNDDKDRVLVKNDGSYTYLLPDIAYHLDKYNRGFDKLVDFFGADHHGYISRLKAAIQILGKNEDDLEVDIIQMARMLKDGQEYVMSKRSGKSISLRDLINEAGVDAIRYFFASKAANTHMDLDLDIATKKSNENPVYYAQYAHARMCSILNGYQQSEEVEIYDLLVNPKEIELIKHLNEFTNAVNESAKLRQPHRICNYIQKLAALFHSFYGECKIISDDINLTNQRYDLVKGSQIVLKNALSLIGVSAPEKM